MLKDWINWQNVLRGDFNALALGSLRQTSWFFLLGLGSRWEPWGLGCGASLGVFWLALRYIFGIDHISPILPGALLYIMLVVIVVYATAALLAIPIGVILRVGLNRLNRADDIHARNELMDIIDEATSIEELQRMQDGTNRVEITH